jgi:CelD/BcsL family acetyltransferase involved in cellulose biosynthesis
MQAAAELRVSPFMPADRADWDGFVAGHPDATFFHHSGWRDAIEQGLGHRTCYLLVRRGGQIEGVLPLAEVKSRLFGHALISTPGCVYGGALTISEDARQALTGVPVNWRENSVSMPSSFGTPLRWSRTGRPRICM